MDLTILDDKIKAALTLEYMNAVYAVSEATQQNEYLYKIKKYKKARYLKQLLNAHSKALNVTS